MTSAQSQPTRWLDARLVYHELPAKEERRSFFNKMKILGSPKVIPSKRCTW
jgi:hypothetical protein